MESLFKHLGALARAATFYSTSPEGKLEGAGGIHSRGGTQVNGYSFHLMGFVSEVFPPGWLATLNLG